MPATARARGLANSFEPLAAIEQSAEFLRELRAQFGNLGLAAAAHNAGPGRVRAWLDGRSPLPLQTRTYVHIITGRAANTWLGSATNRKTGWEPPSHAMQSQNSLRPVGVSTD